MSHVVCRVLLMDISRAARILSTFARAHVAAEVARYEAALKVSTQTGQPVGCVMDTCDC